MSTTALLFAVIHRRLLRCIYLSGTLPLFYLFLMLLLLMVNKICTCESLKSEVIILPSAESLLRP